MSSKCESKLVGARLIKAEDEIEFLRSLSETCRQDRWPTLHDIQLLIGNCGSPHDSMRETAMTLLWSPPVRNASEYLAWLLGQFPRLFPKPHQMPSDLLGQVLDVVGFLENVPGMLKVGDWWSKLLRTLPPAGYRWLRNRPLPLESFADALWKPAAIWHPGSKRSKASGRRAWLLLARRLRAAAKGVPWATLTTMDLGRLFRSVEPLRSVPISRVRHRRIAGALVRPPMFQQETSRSGTCHSTAIQFWNGYGPQTLRFLQALLQVQAEELRRVRDLSQSLSARTGRVVLSCHNATVTAASGWGLPMMHEYFSNEEIWHSFESTVTSKARESLGTSDEQSQLMEKLRVLYEERLIHPKIRQAFEESRQRAILTGLAHGVARNSTLKPFHSFLPSQLIEELQSNAEQGWAGVLSPHQRIHPREVLTWRDNHRDSWVLGFRLLAAIIQEGQHLLDRGELGHLVVPWIDKFFISSRRNHDLAFFPLMVKCLELYGCRPLILLWEDTSHASCPSLQLAMREWRDTGWGCRGIGVFREDGTELVDRGHAEDFIVAHHADTRWFALRPFSDSFQPRSLEQLLAERDYSFLNPGTYDSSWKDNLAFIYTGTQVAPLVSVQCDAELFSAWVVVDGRKWPFGAFLRRTLRRMALGHEDETLAPDSLAGRYAEWANLL